jgi:hypothetical protein
MEAPDGWEYEDGRKALVRSFKFTTSAKPSRS